MVTAVLNVVVSLNFQMYVSQENSTKMYLAMVEL